MKSFIAIVLVFFVLFAGCTNSADSTWQIPENTQKEKTGTENQNILAEIPAPDSGGRAQQILPQKEQPLLPQNSATQEGSIWSVSELDAALQELDLIE